MNHTKANRGWTAGSAALWAAVVACPLAVLLLRTGTAADLPQERLIELLLRSASLAGAIAGAAALLGLWPARLLAFQKRGKPAFFLLFLLPLVMPRYVLYYAWSLLLGPTTDLGAWLAQDIARARTAGTVISTGVLVCWYWPLAALVMSQGWRRCRRNVLDAARLEASRWRVLTRIVLPLVLPSAGLAFGVCFVLSLSEFTTFHLAGIETVGTELAVLYELSGGEVIPAGFVWPMAAVSLAIAAALAAAARQWGRTVASGRGGEASPPAGIGAWVLFAVLLTITLIGPVAVLATQAQGLEEFRRFFLLHPDDLAGSLFVAAGSAALCLAIAWGAMHLMRMGRAGRWLSFVMQGTIFLAMFLPGALIGIAMLQILSASDALAGLRQNALLVSAGQAARFSGMALVLLLLMRDDLHRTLSEMAAMDGASRGRTFLQVHLPRVWPVGLGVVLLIMIFSMTELSATMVLLPAGVPNFAQRLLNQMHYARDQQVIASCLILIGTFGLLAGALTGLLWIGRRRLGAAGILLGILLVVGGCGGRNPGDPPDVEATFGRRGRGRGEFVYPRVLDLYDGQLYVVDKTGRIQRMDTGGRWLRDYQMPEIEAGKPVGLTVREDGRIYVADTHYHQVLVWSPEGEIVQTFGQYGEEDGCFIYPTDVEFLPDGRILVSEYGGNDRISIFSEDGTFVRSFGSFGTGEGQLSRPSALCIDRTRKRLYVADACNHRIAVYDLEGHLQGYIGRVGREPGQLRYPYDLDLAHDGRLVVAEYGNNRVQVFSPEGESLGIYGTAGRQPGQLAYPWAVAVDEDERMYIVDSGNNRIQVWDM